MHITGENIDTYLVKVKPDYSIKTKLALDWIQVTNGNWSAVDRGSDSDIYETTIKIEGKQDVVEAFIDSVEANRLYDTYHFYLSGFEYPTEYIFGLELDYSSPMDVTVLSIDDVKQRVWKVWEATITLRLLSPPSFVESPSFPILQNIDTSITKKVDWSMNKYDSYNGTFTYIDHEADVGDTTIAFTMDNDNVKKLKTYYRTQRGSTIALTQSQLPGISNPFGSTRPTWPINVKILELNDGGWFGLTHRKMSMKIAEVI